MEINLSNFRIELFCGGKMPCVEAFNPKIKVMFVCCLPIASDYQPQLDSAASSQQDQRDASKLAH